MLNHAARLSFLMLVFPLLGCSEDGSGRKAAAKTSQQETTKTDELQGLHDLAVRLIDKENVKGFDALSPEEQVVFLVWIADGEVGNGGFHAICYNSTGNYSEHFPKAFLAIGASEAFEIFQEFLNIADPPANHGDRVKWHNALPENGATIRAISALDDRYFEVRSEIDGLLSKYTLRHFN